MTKPQQGARWTFHLEQMIQATHKIQRYITGMSRDDFLKDDRTIDAVVRNLEILGEATHHIPNKVRNTYGAVPWTALRHMRNFLAHEYFSVDAKIIWETVVRDIQGLKMSLKRLSKEAME